MQRQENVNIKRAFIDHLDALRAYCKLVTRYGQKLTEVEQADMKLRQRQFMHVGRTFGLSDGAMRGLIYSDISCE